MQTEGSPGVRFLLKELVTVMAKRAFALYASCTPSWARKFCSYACAGHLNGLLKCAVYGANLEEHLELQLVQM